jgi:hypothetical protein
VEDDFVLLNVVYFEDDCEMTVSKLKTLFLCKILYHWMAACNCISRALERQGTHDVGLCALVGGWWVVLFLVGCFCSLFWGFTSISGVRVLLVLLGFCGLTLVVLVYTSCVLRGALRFH